MACLKALTELLLWHVRLASQVHALFDANEIAIPILVRIEASGLDSGRTPSLTPRAQVIGTKQPRHVWTSNLRALSSYGARFKCSCNPSASGPIREVLGHQPGVLSSALHPPGHLVWVWYGPI